LNEPILEDLPAAVMIAPAVNVIPSSRPQNYRVSFAETLYKQLY
jgi:hypothetical protein